MGRRCAASKRLPCRWTRVNGRKGREINDLTAADAEIFQDAVPLPGRGTRRAVDGINSQEAEGLSL